jgi:hypothetical protein
MTDINVTRGGDARTAAPLGCRVCDGELVLLVAGNGNGSMAADAFAPS